MKSTHRVTCAVALLAAGCFQSAGTASDAGVPLPCNDLSPGDAVVQTTSGVGTIAPIASGGELGAGTYHLIASIYYPSTACTIAGVATRLRLAPSSATTGTLEITTATASGDSLSESVSYTASGASLSVRIDCIVPDTTGLRGNVSQISYSANPTELRLFKTTPTCGKSVDTYVLDGGGGDGGG